MRLGLVGFGSGGQFFHLPYIQAAPDWELVGVVTRSPERRSLLAREAPGVPAMDSLDAVIDAGAEVVVITTPPATRRELVLRALERGVHVVADKPFAPDLETAQELADAADAAGTVLTVFHNRRWDTDFVTLQSVLASGELGTPWRANFILDQDEPGAPQTGPGDGLLRDLGAHVVDQAIQALGPVARVDAHLDWIDVDHGRVDVGFALGLHHVSGAYSSVSSSKLGHRSERGMIVYGPHGSYASRMRDVQAEDALAGLRPVAARAAGRTWGAEDPERWGVLSTTDGERVIPAIPGDHTEFYLRLHRALAEGGPLPVRLDEALHTVAVLDAARRSDAEHRSVAVGVR